MDFFSNIRDRLSNARDSIGDFFGGIGSLVWYAVGAMVILILVVVLLSVLPSSVDPNVVQLTMNAAATESNRLVPTIARNLTQTPPQAALTGSAPTLALGGRRLVTQYAASASSETERAQVAQGAVQAVGPPNTPECGDFRTAWATENPNSTGELTLYFAELVRPRAVRIYETYNPGFITQVDFVDVFGETHVVYQSAPQALGQCPFVREIAIDDVEAPGNTVVIRVDQTASTGGWNEIDAVELVGIKY